MRKLPATGDLAGPVKTSYKLTDVIRALGEELVPPDDKTKRGLGVPYSQIVELLKKMCEKGAIKAEFVAGPLTPLAQMPKEQPQQRQLAPQLAPPQEKIKKK